MIERCLSKAPEGRYESTRDLARELEDLGSSAPSNKFGWKRWTGAAAIGAVLSVLATLYVSQDRASAPTATAPSIRSIAVLPLENLSGDPEQEYFATGMHESLITSLSRIGALRVISRTSVMRYRDTEKTLPEIARELGVDAVVEGSVLRVGDQIRISAQLIDGTTDEHLWVESYDRDMRDVLALQSQVARAIAEEVHVSVTPEEGARLAETGPVDPDVYENYLKGRHHWSQATEEGFRQSVARVGRSTQARSAVPLLQLQRWIRLASRRSSR